MKIFISHSSKNANYGKALVELLTSIGVAHDKITFTSDTSYGIPPGENIFNWLKERISEKPFVIYLLSPEYFSSVACLNEMGAAWVVENRHVAIFTPEFNIDSVDFRNGVLDPREMGFRLNDEDRLTQFIEQMKYLLGLSTNQILVNRASQKFLSTTREIDSAAIPPKHLIREQSTPSAHSSAQAKTPQPNITPPKALPTRIQNPVGKLEPTERFFKDFEDGRLRDEEILLIHYASETSRFSLGVGWRAEEETRRISEWEELNEYSNTLSKKYEAAINRMEVRNLIKVSERTSHGNPRQIDFVKDLKNRILSLPDDFQIKAEEVVQTELEKKNSRLDDPFPF